MHKKIRKQFLKKLKQIFWITSLRRVSVSDVLITVFIIFKTTFREDYILSFRIDLPVCIYLAMLQNQAFWKVITCNILILEH